MAVKVQLDGQALAALIGGDSAIEVELRHGVVEEFARHYLKKVANEDSFKRAITSTINDVKNQMENMVRDELNRIGCRIRTSSNGVYQIELPAVVAEQITKHVDMQLNLAIRSAIQNAVKTAVDEFDTNQTKIIVEEVTRQLKQKVCFAVQNQVSAIKVQVDGTEKS